MFKWFELGIETHVTKVQGGMERWPHDYKEIKYEMEIMMLNKEESDQGKGINIGFYFCRSKLSREMIDRI